MRQPIFYFKRLLSPYFVHYMSPVINIYPRDLGTISAQKHFKQGSMWKESFEFESTLGWRIRFIRELAESHVSCFLCKKKRCKCERQCLTKNDLMSRGIWGHEHLNSGHDQLLFVTSKRLTVRSRTVGPVVLQSHTDQVQIPVASFLALCP